MNKALILFTFCIMNTWSSLATTQALGLFGAGSGESQASSARIPLIPEMSYSFTDNGSGGDSMIISTWAKIDSRNSDSYSRIFTYHLGAADYKAFRIRFTGDNAITAEFRKGSWNTANYTHSENFIGDDTWHHFAMVIEPSGFKVYLDGSPVITKAVALAQSMTYDAANNNNVISIGAAEHGGNGYINGGVKDTRIYVATDPANLDSPVTDQNIADIMNDTAGTVIPANMTIVTRYTFDSTLANSTSSMLKTADAIAWNAQNDTTPVVTPEYLVLTPVLGLILSVEKVAEGNLVEWTVEHEADVKVYQILKKVGKEWILVGEIEAGGRVYSYLDQSDVSGVYAIRVVDSSGYTQILTDSNEEVVLVLNSGWNLVSLPFEQSLKEELFIWNTASRTYELTDSVEARQGFWIYSDSEETVAFKGQVAGTPLALGKGWNLVGPSENTELPDDLVVYGWGKAYEQINILTVGNGYWIYCEDDRELILP